MSRLTVSVETPRLRARSDVRTVGDAVSSATIWRCRVDFFGRLLGVIVFVTACPLRLETRKVCARRLVGRKLMGRPEPLEGLCGREIHYSTVDKSGVIK